MRHLASVSILLLLLVLCIGCSEEKSTGPTDGPVVSDLQKPGAPAAKPSITSITPVSGEIGDELTIIGTSFGSSQLYGSYVLFDGVAVSGSGVILEWTDTKIRVLVPSGHLPGTRDVVVKLKTKQTPAFPFTLVTSSPVFLAGLWWMGENLNVDKYNDGSPITQITDATLWDNATEGAWCYFNNDPVLGSFYGKLYNWYAVNDQLHGGIAPPGWRVPTDQEWKNLSISLGMDPMVADQTGGYFGTDEGGKMKECGTNLWMSPNLGATNSSGFTALPGSMRSGLTTYDFSAGTGAVWWSSTEDPTTELVWVRAVDRSLATTYRNALIKTHGFAVRCVRVEN